MKQLLYVIASVILSMLIVAGIVFGLNDNRIFVPPPDAVAEGFLKQMIGKRYERAVPFLSDELASQVDADSLRKLWEELEPRIGDHGEVHGEEKSIDGDSATANAVIKTSGGDTVVVPIPLTRQDGLWAVAGVEGLGRF